MNPFDIKAGKTYKLQGFFTPHTLLRKVEEVRGDKVVVMVHGSPTEFDLKTFASVARVELDV